MTTSRSHVRRRLVVLCGIIWLPLLVLCAIEGTLLGGVAIPFLADVETHARFLVAVPLMIVAELLVHRRMRGIVAQFVERKLVPAAAMDRFREAIRSAMTWRNSIAAELALLAHRPEPRLLPADRRLRARDVHLVRGRARAGALTLPGFWLRWVSNPILQFLLLRWLYRLVIWARFLWQVSRIELDLIPTHPDRNGGLGFLGGSARLYSPLLASFSAMVAGLVASRIFHEGASLADFKLEIVLLVAIGMVLVLGPLTVFAPQILAAKRQGLREYGAFAADYMRDFDRRWLRSADHDEESLLGSGDIQSLADLGNAFRHQGDEGGAVQPRHVSPAGLGDARAVRAAGVHHDSARRVARPDHRRGLLKGARQGADRNVAAVEGRRHLRPSPCDCR